MPDDSGPSQAPTEAALHEAAVAYLARYSATRATLARVLNRRIDRWARATDSSEAAAQAAVAKRAVPDVVARLAAAGAVDDASFAQARSRSLTRAGHSRRATAAHLAARGVPAEIVSAALPDDSGAELAAAVAFTRRRRIGPFRSPAEGTDDAAQDRRHRELGALARAGFSHAIAQQALGMPLEEAAAMLAALRRG